MHVFRYLALPLLVLCLTCNQSDAQDTLHINKSNNKVYISGEPFYIHIVKKGQTLYRIAQAYDVTVDEIERENFNIKAQGLSVGQPVKIPVKSTRKTDASKQSPEIPHIHVVDSGETTYSIARQYHVSLDQIYALNPKAQKTIYPGQKLFIPKAKDTTKTKMLHDDDYIYHIVKKSETLYSIAQKYGVKARKLKKNNRNIDPDNLQPGQIIKISAGRVNVKTEQPEKTDKRFYYYNVKPGETLYAIAKKFDIEQKKIKTHNPRLKEREMLAGEYIKLPRNQIKTSENKPDTTIHKIKKPETHWLTDTCLCPDNTDIDKVTVAMMLPLYSYINDTLNQGTTYPEIYKPSKIFLDFYEGVLLAVNDLSKKGLNIDLHVLDTKNDTNQVKTITESEIFPYFDLIIGPVYSQNLSFVVKKAEKYRIPVISPLSTKSGFLENYPMGFQVSPTEKILHQKTLEAIRKLDADNYIIVKNGNRPEEDFIESFKKQYFKGKTMHEISHLGYAEVTYYAGDDELNLDPFVDSLHNLVIVPSSDKAFVSDVISRLNTLSEDHKITLFGHPRLINYENIDIHFFHNLNTHIFNLNYINYDQPAVSNFVYEFRKFFEKEPKKYAFLGYDISTYFIHAYQLFGKKFYCCFDRYHPNLLQMQLDFHQSKKGAGFINEKILLLNFQRNDQLRPVQKVNR